MGSRTEFAEKAALYGVVYSWIVHIGVSALRLQDLSDQNVVDKYFFTNDSFSSLWCPVWVFLAVNCLQPANAMQLALLDGLVVIFIPNLTDTSLSLCV